jgi:hypothetical protein
MAAIEADGAARVCTSPLREFWPGEAGCIPAGSSMAVTGNRLNAGFSTGFHGAFTEHMNPTLICRVL